MKRNVWWVGLFASGLWGCASTAPPVAAPEIEALATGPSESGVAAGGEAEAPGHGGRLFDRWYAATETEFVPDDPDTDALDGRGGPFGNGTLPDAQGKAMPNPGHDYRLKNLLGWDLRGAEGIYGPEHLAKQDVLLPNLMVDTDSRERWIARLTDGGDAFPAYGSVLQATDIEALTDFLLGVRDGRLVQPEDIYALAEGAAEHVYTLQPEGDPERGHALFRQRCARCHGDDGTDMLFDDGQYSLGTLARTKGYEVAMKILHGQPGTPMTAQVTGNREQQAESVRDLLWALCDRERYPRGEASGADVNDGDPRCGDALR